MTTKEKEAAALTRHAFLNEIQIKSKSLKTKIQNIALFESIKKINKVTNG